MGFSILIPNYTFYYSQFYPTESQPNSWYYNTHIRCAPNVTVFGKKDGVRQKWY